MMRKGQSEIPLGLIITGILAFIIAGMALTVGLQTQSAMDQSGQSSFEQLVENESHTGLTSGASFTVDEPPLVNDTTLVVYNDTANSETLTEGTHYTVQNTDTGEIKLSGTGNVAPDVYVDYTGYPGKAYDAYTSTQNNVYQGFETASNTPTVIAGALMLLILLGVFGVFIL